MNRVRLAAMVVTILTLLTFTGLASAQTVPPAVFVGVASIDGLPAPEGTLVVALVDGNPAGTAIVMGAEGKVETLMVMGPGQEVTFTIDGLRADQTSPWMQGGSAMLNLTASRASSAGLFPPHVFIGTASINGLPAPEGTVLVAFLDEKLAGSAVTGADGKFSNLMVMGPGARVTFKIARHDATQALTWELGGLDAVHLTASRSDLPAVALKPLGDKLVRVFEFDNATKTWSFYDPREEFTEVNTLSTLVPGEAYWVKVTETTTATLKARPVTLTCARGNCWNHIVW